jgi:hypothetical protein
MCKTIKTSAIFGFVSSQAFNKRLLQDAQGKGDSTCNLTPPQWDYELHWVTHRAVVVAGTCNWGSHTRAVVVAGTCNWGSHTRAVIVAGTCNWGSHTVR